MVVAELGSRRAGLTVSSLVSVSLSPPLVSISLGRSASLFEVLDGAEEWCVSILAGDQAHLAQHFARSVPPIVQWDGIAVLSEDGRLLDGAVGWMVVRTVERFPVGDHVIFVGETERVEQGPGQGALIYVRPPVPAAVTGAVIFDMDGVLVESEQVWDEVREELARERGGRWHDGAQRAMMGMSSPEWSSYMHDRIGLAERPEEINRIVVERMLERYAAGPPWVAGAREAVRRTAEQFTLGLASSSNRELIDVVLAAGAITGLFHATVSSEEVARGKPAPDVYLEAARRLGVDPAACAAIEDSHNGIRSAKAAGMICIAIPNPQFPPGDATGEADLVLGSIEELTAETVARLAR